jgi:hypothetical protein
MPSAGTIHRDDERHAEVAHLPKSGRVMVAQHRTEVRLFENVVGSGGGEIGSRAEATPGAGENGAAILLLSFDMRQGVRQGKHHPGRGRVQGLGIVQSQQRDSAVRFQRYAAEIDDRGHRHLFFAGVTARSAWRRWDRSNTP